MRADPHIQYRATLLFVHPPNERLRHLAAQYVQLEARVTQMSSNYSSMAVTVAEPPLAYSEQGIATYVKQLASIHTIY